MIALIINYQRLTYPSIMADYLADCNVEPVFLDNNSDYEPLLEYYEETPYKVMKLGYNFGSAAPWHPAAGVLDELGLHGDFIVTDPDLGIDHIPKDWLSVLREGLKRYSFAWKSGFSLRISDLPDTKVGGEARRHEAGYWNSPLDGGKYYRAFIDTTFCLCRTRMHDFPAVRSGPPYEARHLPWYHTSLESLPGDEVYYLKSQKARGTTFWTSIIAEELGV